MNMCQHAEQILQYAEDVKTYFEPWKLWQFRKKGSDAKWQDVEAHPQWTYYNEYQRKPEMLSVTLANGEVVSWPAPHCTELEYGDPYFYFVPTHGDIVLKKWDCAPWDRNTLSNGYIHLTKEAAEQHATALHKINTQGRDDG